MALNFKPIQFDGEFTSLQKTHLLKTLNSISGGASITVPQTTPAALTSGAGTPSITTTVSVGATNSGDVSGAINNNFATIVTRINTLRTELVAAGVLI